MKKSLFLLLLIVLFSKVTLADIILNEIFPNPITDESLNEWIELYNDGENTVNVSNWVIGDDKDNDTLTGGLYYGAGTVIPAKGFAVITDSETRVYNNFDVSPNAIKLYIDDSSITDYGLSNSGETIYLYNSDNELIDSVTYEEVDDEKSFTLIDGLWVETEPSIGYSNYEDYVEEGCDWEVEILLNDTEFDIEDFSWKLQARKIEGETTLLTSKAIIKDIYGDIVKEYSPFTNSSATTKKTSSTYTPNLDPGLYFIYANLTVDCNDVDLDNNFDDEHFIIKANKAEESLIKIEDIYDLGSDNQAEFGDTVRIKLVVYKGNTTKDSIKAWIESKKGEKASKQSKTNVYDNYIEYTLTLPIQLYPNCGEDLDDGTYYVKVEGLDTADSKEIEIDGISDENCEEIKVTTSTKTTSTKGKKFEYELLDYPYFVKVGEEFNVRVKVDNNDKEDYKIAVWSYVYRGSKCYSGDKEQNKEKFVLKADEVRVIELKNNVLEAESGQYNLKVKINKNNQKTDYEITKPITIESINNQSIEKEKSMKKNGEVVYLEQGFRPEIIYESSTYKVKKIIAYFIIGILSFLSVILIWKR